VLRKDLPKPWHKYVYKKEIELPSLVNYLWFIRDNSVSCTNFLGYIKKDKKWVMNRPGKIFYSNCKGGELEVFFTKSDLIKAAVIKQKVDGLCFFEKKAFEVVDNHYDHNNPRAMIKYLEYNWQENRIERALFFWN
jgi:hypothetical protein